MYLACLRWARGSGTLDYSDSKQFEIGDNLSEMQKTELKKVLKHVRLPLIPAEILVEKIYPAKLVDMEDLFLASAF